MSVRDPVRLLDSSQVASAYPNELLVNFSTGEFTILDSNKNPIKNPSTPAGLGFGFGTCSTGASTAAKEVTMANYELTTGGYVVVKFTNAVGANATMAINGKAAKAIFHKGSAIKANVIEAGDIATFIYDGTRYQLLSVDNPLGKSGVTADSYGPSADASPTYGGTFTVPYLTVDKYGRITAASTKTITLPPDTNVDEKVKQTADTETNSNIPVLLSDRADPTSGTPYESKYVPSVSVTPSTGTLNATKFAGDGTDIKVGSTSGNAVYTTTGGKLTAGSLSTSDPDANGTSLSFISNASQDAKGKITLTKKTVSAMGAASSSAAGSSGLVPAPAKGDQDKVLSGAGTWVNNTDRYVNTASFADDTTATPESPVKMTLTRAGSDSASVTAHIPKVSSTSAGVVPAGAAVTTQSQSTKFLREDGTWTIPSYTTNTDTSVTSVDNHYAPSANAGSELSADASGATAAWSIDVVKGLKIQRDAKGHVTGVTVTSGKIPANPGDTKVTQTVKADNVERPLLTAPTAQSSTTTTTAAFSTNIKANASTGALTATKFIGDGTGINVGSTFGNAVYTTTSGKLTAGSLSTSDPDADGTSLTFIATASQDAKGKMTLAKKTVSDMVGASSSAAGTHGLVPAPSKGDQSKVLSGAGTWVNQTTNTDRYVNTASFADDTTATPASPVKMTLTRAGSDSATVGANIPKVSSTSAGVAPKGAAVETQSQTTKFLREDGTWAAPSYTAAAKNAALKIASGTGTAVQAITMNESTARTLTIKGDETYITGAVSGGSNAAIVTLSHADPTTDSDSTLTANATGATAAWSIDVVKGVEITRDAKGHVTGVSVTSGKIPANPNTNTYVSAASFADVSTNTPDSPVKMSLTRSGTITTAVTANLPKVSSTSAGVAPKGAEVETQSQATKFLREDGTWAAPSYTVNTDTSVTAVGNHYAPSANVGSELSADASGATAAWGIDVVKGLKIQRDAKGHVTGVTVTSGKIPANPGDTKVTQTKKTDSVERPLLTAPTDQTNDTTTTAVFSTNIKANASTGVITAGGLNVGNGTITAGSISVSSGITGNADTATTLKTSRNFSITGGATASAVSFNGSKDVALNVKSLDATKLTGLVPITSIPHGAIEKLEIVTDQAAMLKLTKERVQNGDTVKQNSTGLMYFVVDHDKLSTDGETPGSMDAFEAYTVGSATNAASADAFSEAKEVTLTGDVSGSASSTAGWSISTTLANTGVAEGPYGSSTNASPAHGGKFYVPYFEVDTKGRLTVASTKTITLPPQYSLPTATDEVPGGIKVGNTLEINDGVLDQNSTVITATSAGPTVDVTGTEGTTVAIPRISVDKYGRVIALTSYNLTNKNTTYTVGNRALKVSSNTGTATQAITVNESSADRTLKIAGDGTYLTGAVSGSSNAAVVTISHKALAPNGTGGTTSPSTPQIPGYGETFIVPVLTYDAGGHITAVDTTTVKIPDSDNTDTKVTSVDNHYTPSANAGSALTANASGATAAWGIDVVKGITVSRDAKGHVTAISVTSGKIPANPNSDILVKQSTYTTDTTTTFPLLASSESSPTSGNAYEAKYSTAVTLTPKNGTITATNLSVTNINGVAVGSSPEFTDTKVTAVGNHYTPSANTSYKLTANASGATAAWSIDVVKGVEIQRDAKGHVTGVNVTSGKIPANPNTHYTSKNIVGATDSATANAKVDSSTNAIYLNHLEEGTVTSAHKIVGSGLSTVSSDSSGNITINTTYTPPTATASANGIGRVAGTTPVSVAYSSGVATVSVAGMTGASSSAAGAAGLVPAPAKGDQDKVLSGAGTWVNQTTNTDNYVSGASFADNSSVTDTPLKMTLTRTGTLEDITADLPKVSSSSAGVVPMGASVTTQSQGTRFLREDGTWAVPSYTTNTDTSVTSVNNHYTPSANSSYKLNANASGATAAWGIDVVKGVEIQRDAKGHVTGVTVTSGKIPANPNSDTLVKQSTYTTDTTTFPLLASANSSPESGNAYEAKYSTAVTLTPKDGTITATNLSVTNINGVAVGSSPKFTDTDTKVTAVGNHYTPSANADSALTASASGATAAWSIDVVKGITVSRDAKGHVTAISVTSGKIPANPNTDNYVDGASFADNSSVTATPLRMTLTRTGTLEDITADLPKVSSSTAGVAPKGAAVSSQSQSTRFLREDGTWAVPSYTANTDNKVSMTSSSTSANYPILTTNAASPTSGTAYGSLYDTNVYLNHSTGVITAKGLTISTAGNVSGVQQSWINLSLPTGSSWSGSAAPYTYALTVSGILASDIPTVDMRPSGTYATDKTMEENWCQVYRGVTSANTITFYAHEKPSAAIPITIKVVR